MSFNISKAELEALGDLGEKKATGPVKLTVLQKVLAKYADDFQMELEKNLKDRKVTASGRLRDSIRAEFDDDGMGFRIIMADYFDYTNKGVQGVDYNYNAPNSPYKYRHYKMNPEGRASIKEYIEDGYAKISTVRKDAAVGIGLERKGVGLRKRKSPIDTKVDTLIYAIKRYGIKTTNYFDDAFNKVFKDFEVTAADFVNRQIVITLEKLNKTK